MIEIRHDLPLNKPKKGSAEEAPIEVHYEAQTEGRTVAKGKGNSILAPFLAGLWVNAGGFQDAELPFVEMNLNDSTSTLSGVTGVEQANGTIRIFIDSTNSSFSSTFWWYWVSVIPGTNVGGLYRVKNVSNQNYMDLVDPWTEEDLTLVGTPDFTDAYPVAQRLFSGSSMPFQYSNSNATLLTDDLQLGINHGQPQTVELNTTWVDNWHIRTLDGSSQIINAPVIGDNESFIQFTRDFTNNKDHEVGINAIMLPGRVGADLVYPLAIDPVNIVVPAGNTVTINYRVRISNTAAGGLLWQFTELLYRHLASTSRESRNIFNENRTHWRDEYTFSMMAGGGNTGADGEKEWNLPRIHPTSTGPRAVLVGPQVGTGTTDVINTNIALADRIPAGEGANELVYYGSLVTPITLDNDAGEAYFDVGRVFENRSGSAISISETGLYCVGNSSNNTAPREDDLHCIARHRLSSAVNVPNGEMLRLTYRMKVVV